MSPERKSTTAILAGQIASALIGFALGVVVTLLAIVDWPPAAARPALEPPGRAPAADAAPAAAAPPTVLPVQNAAALPAAAPAPSPAPAPTPPVPPPAQVATAPAPAAVPVEPPAPPPAPKPPKPKPRLSEPSPSRARYVVQAGAFVSAEIAGRVAARLSEHDHPAEVLERTDGIGRAWNVVRLTEVFASRGEAERSAAVLKRSEDLDTLIIRLPAAPPDDAAKDADKPAGKAAETTVDKPAAAGAAPP